MSYLLIGLLLFLAVHSLRIVAPAWREARIRQWGELPWKGVISVFSVVGFVLIIWGYGQARAQPVQLWLPPMGLRHAAALLTLPAFILLVAAFAPRNHFKAWVGHPMVLGVTLWALAHLLVSGSLRGVVLFGSFLLWSMISFTSARRRDRAAGQAAPRGGAMGTLISVLIGAAAWAGFAFHLHLRWIGVAPFG